MMLYNKYLLRNQKREVKTMEQNLIQVTMGNEEISLPNMKSLSTKDSNRLFVDGGPTEHKTAAFELIRLNMPREALKKFDELTTDEKISTVEQWFDKSI
jgi:hypothetical protein